MHKYKLSNYKQISKKSSLEEYDQNVSTVPGRTLPVYPVTLPGSLFLYELLPFHFIIPQSCPENINSSIHATYRNKPL